MPDYTQIDSEPDRERRMELFDKIRPSFVPSEKELIHWIHKGTQGCACALCNCMRVLSDRDCDPEPYWERTFTTGD